MPDEPSSPPPRFARLAFQLGWYVVVPTSLAWVCVTLLRGAYEKDPTLGLPFRFVSEQSVPAFIIFFTIFVSLLYNFRHSLPFSKFLKVAGRQDIPQEFKRDFEQAAQLLEEARRVQRKSGKAIDRHVKKSARNELDEALEDLRSVLEDEDFEKNRFADVADRAHSLTEKHLSRWRKSELREYAESILVAVGVALALRAFVVEAFKIPSGSMLPTLQIQDHIFVNKLAYGLSLPFSKARVFEDMPPERGDVIVFEFPYPNPGQPNDDFIKRVVGLGGDTLYVENGHPIINGWKVPFCRVGRYEFSEGEREPSTGELFVEFLDDESYLTVHNDTNRGKQGPFKVEEGQVFVLGDNRNNSHDSRAWGPRGRGVPYGHIKGRALFIWLSFASGGFTTDRIGLSVMGKPTLPKGDPAELTQRIEKCLAERPAKTTPPRAN